MVIISITVTFCIAHQMTIKFQQGEVHIMDKMQELINSWPLTMNNNSTIITPGTQVEKPDEFGFWDPVIGNSFSQYLQK